MTLEELMHETASLGFEKEVENEDFFLFCANRALRAIHADRPKIANTLWYQERSHPSYYTKVLLHRPSEVLTLRLPCGAYTFRLTGEGRFFVDGVSQEFSAHGDRFCGLVKKEIRFEGASRYTIHELAVYEGYTDPEGLPDGCDRYVYDLMEYCKSFLGPSEPPKNEKGSYIPGCELIGKSLYVPTSYEGDIRLAYRQAPMPILRDDPSAEIDISPETSPLLPILTAAYFWLDDEPEKAQYYMNLYREGMIKLKGSDPLRINARYEDVVGWI